jgi:hypothetical protein
MAKRSVSPNWKATDPLGTRTGHASAEPGLSANHGRDVVSLPGASYRLGIPIRPAAVPSLTHERETPPATPLTGLRLACHGSVQWPFATGNGSTRLGMAFPHPEEARAPSLLCCLRRLEQLSCWARIPAASSRRSGDGPAPGETKQATDQATRPPATLVVGRARPLSGSGRAESAFGVEQAISAFRRMMAKLVSPGTPPVAEPLLVPSGPPTIIVTMMRWRLPPARWVLVDHNRLGDEQEIIRTSPARGPPCCRVPGCPLPGLGTLGTRAWNTVDMFPRLASV